MVVTTKLRLVYKSTHWLLWVYLLLLTVAELATTLVSPWLGLTIDVLLLIGFTIHAAIGSDLSERNLSLALTLAPLTRLLSISLPLIKFPQLAWYPIVSIPLLAAAWIIFRILQIPRQALGLRWGNPWQQLTLAGAGLSIGALEYLILTPGPLIPNLTWKSFLFASLILIVFTGFTEEVIFRGLLQSLGLRAMGVWSLVYVSLLFAVMHIGYRSLLDFIFVLIVGAIFGVIVYWSGSILGVTLVHGLANVTFFLLMPTVTQLPSGWLATNILGMILIGMAIAIFCVILTIRVPLLRAATKAKESNEVKSHPPLHNYVVKPRDNRPAIQPSTETSNTNPRVGSDFITAIQLINDELWQDIEPFLPGEPLKPKPGRPRKPNRVVLTGILFALKTGIPWKMLPQEMVRVSGTTCMRRLHDWKLTGVWESVNNILIERLAQADQINWSRVSRKPGSAPVSKTAELITDN